MRGWQPGSLSPRSQTGFTWLPGGVCGVGRPCVCECGGRPVCFGGLAAPGLLGKLLPAAGGGCLDLSGRRNPLAV